MAFPFARLVLAGGCLLASPAAAQRSATKPTPTRPAISIANPVLAGDYPDPSVTQVGNTYWATATSSN